MTDELGPADRSAVDRIVADLDYPMLIVTAAAGGDRSGCLVGFATQCSIDPTRFVVCISRTNHTVGVATQADGLIVHFASSEAEPLARLFGETTEDRTDKFDRCRWRVGPFGAPILDDCERWVAGRTVEQLDFGDHVGFLLAPVEADAAAWSGQLGFQQACDWSPGHAP